MKAKLYRAHRTHPVVDASGDKSGPDALLPVLQYMQANQGHLESDVLGAVSDKLNVADSHTFGVASFYSMLATQPQVRNVIRVCDGPVCQLLGCQRVREALDAESPSSEFEVERTSCLGLCDRAPAALINLEPCGPLSPSNVRSLFDGWRGMAPSYLTPRKGEVRVALGRLGILDPNDIESTLRAGGYEALSQALCDSPAAVLQAVSDSGLQGRGGAAFPTGRKWQMVAHAANHDTSPTGTWDQPPNSPHPTANKYVVCNADESEPAAFKDRVLMEEDPHLLLEGMALAGYAVGAEAGYIYVRGEYETASVRLEQAVAQAEQRNWLGKDIQGSGFSFRVHVHRGAGAYICGEETALLESLEGFRGEPRLRPPYPTTCGFRGKPTVVNNVETLCKVPAIVQNGPRWYRSMGVADSPGTKLFTVTGHVKQPGLFEAPLGITLSQAIENFCGGMQDGSLFKMALTGGAAGTIVGEAALDESLDFGAVKHAVSLGSGAILVCDQTVSVVRLLQWLLHFFEVESCGKCTPCREGTREVRQIVDRIIANHAEEKDSERIHQLSRMLRATSFCGLGQSVAWPIDSALANFAEEFTPT